MEMIKKRVLDSWKKLQNEINEFFLANQQLNESTQREVQKILNKKGHPAKQTFQALRIAVNDELRVFEVSINDALDMLNPNGYAVVITFHSLEDRICKTVFKERSTLDIPEGLPVIIKEEAPFELITRHPITSTEEELEYNNRAHSAKMRVLRKR